MSDQVKLKRDGKILRISLNRADKKNALTAKMYSKMAEAIEAAEIDLSINVIIFTGTEACFTAGNDLQDFQNSPPRDKAAPVYRFILALANSSVAMIAAVDGVAVGIGTTLLLHCDLVYATPQARFQLPFVNLGLLPEAGSSYLLPKLTGHAIASELLMTGRPFYVEEAHRLGLVTHICSAEQLAEQSEISAQQLALKAPKTLRSLKRLLKSDNPELTRQIEREILEFSERLDSPECKEALAAFSEKRAADFSHCEA